AAAVPGAARRGCEPDRGAVVLQGAAMIAELEMAFSAVHEERGGGRRKLDRAVEIGERGLVVAKFLVRDAAIVERAGIARVVADRFAVIRQCALNVALRAIGIAAIVVGDRARARRRRG